jgi:hypothetical protein
VLYATHLLAGVAGAWWENVHAMQPEGQVMTWDAFKNKFRKAHIPSGLIKIMMDKFVGGFHVARTQVPRKGHKGIEHRGLYA